MILGLDIGGANTKAASSDGLFAESIYLPLWKHAPLDEVLGRFAACKSRRQWRSSSRASWPTASPASGRAFESLTGRSEAGILLPGLLLGRERLCLDGPPGAGCGQLVSLCCLAGARGRRLPLCGHGQHHHGPHPHPGERRWPRRRTFCAWPEAIWSTWGCCEQGWMLCCPRRGSED